MDSPKCVVVVVVVVFAQLWTDVNQEASAHFVRRTTMTSNSPIYIIHSVDGIFSGWCAYRVCVCVIQYFDEHDQRNEITVY